MELESQLQQYLAENILFSENGFEYSNDTSLVHDGLIDSTGVLELMLYVESTFGIKVDPLEVTPENFDSVNKLASYIRRKKGGLDSRSRR